MNIPNNIPMPDGLSREEIVDVLLKEEYGYLPPEPIKVYAEEIEKEDKFCAGKAIRRKLELYIETEQGKASFPVYYTCPKSEEKVPAFVHINFRPDVPDRYQPTEEIIDEGYAILSFCYKEVTDDEDEFESGISKVIYPEGRKNATDCGKLGLWAWAAMRVMDYALTLPEIDGEKISVVGHSRLGKTALLCGTMDDRFYCAISNDSGAGGASIARGNTGETVKDSFRRFGYWYNDNYKKYIENEDNMPFDQHWLIVANLNHKVYVASAEGDWWACPENEYLSCVLASKYFEDAGKIGFVHPDRFPETGELLHEGDIAYHIRKGLHYLSREDWSYFIKYLNR